MPLRASVIDDRGSLWKAASTDVGGIGYARAGVHGQNGSEPYQPTEIARLLRLREDLGRETDDDADGMTANADSVGEGGQNITFGRGGITSPPRFFAFRGNRFVAGSTTSIAPGQAITVTMNFAPAERPATGGTASFLQFNMDIIVGVSATNGRTTYALHTLTFDRVTAPRP